MNASPVWLLGAAWGTVFATPLLSRARRAGSRTRAAGLRAESRPRSGLRRQRRHARVGEATAPVVRVLLAPWARARRREHARAVERSLPLALDVLTMAARAGSTPRLALATTARWSPPTIGVVLASVETRCRLGASFVDALADLARDEPVLADAAEILAIADRNGAPMAELVARVAEEARRALRRRSEAHARRVPVRLLFPLVFLVLPAFGLLTVVPAIAAGLRSS